MKRLLICTALALVAPLAAAQEAPREPNAVTLDDPRLAPLRQAQAFNCAKTTCRQIGSCAEACYKLTVCGHRQRDGDGDGIPCENLCSRRC